MSGNFEFGNVDLEEFIKTKKGALQVIEQLRGGAKNSLPFEELHALISALTNPMNNKYRSHSLLSELPVVRARLCKDCKWPSMLEELGPPPAEQNHNFGRCNKRGQAILYCSLYEDSALSEINAEIGECYVISTFVLPKQTTLFTIGELDYFRRTGELYLGSGEQKNKEFYQDLSNEENWKLYSLIDGFIAEEFRQSAKTPQDYKITSAFIDILFKEYKPVNPIEVIVYPSVAFQHGMNFAVTSDAYKKLQLDHSETKIIRITGVYGYGIFDYENVATLKSNCNELLEWEVSNK
jgi:hypothetical protein